MPPDTAASLQAIQDNPCLDVVLSQATTLIGKGMAPPTDIGTGSHVLIGTLAPVADAVDPIYLTEAILILSRLLCSPGRQHRRNATLIAGYAAEYLRGPARPRPPWQCLGVEYDTGHGPADLAWHNPDSQVVFYDEVKTTLVARRAPEDSWIDQCRRYAEAGRTRFGDRFAGVRLLPLGSMNTATLVQPDGTMEPIQPAAVDPLHRIKGS